MGLYSLLFFVGECLLIWISLIRQQRFAVAIFGSGLTLLVLWWLTVAFDVTYLYRRLNLSIYIPLFCAIGLTLAGFIGVLVKLIIWWNKR
jgi:hypothetical protein